MKLGEIFRSQPHRASIFRLANLPGEPLMLPVHIKSTSQTYQNHTTIIIYRLCYGCVTVLICFCYGFDLMLILHIYKVPLFQNGKWKRSFSLKERLLWNKVTYTYKKSLSVRRSFSRRADRGTRTHDLLITNQLL